MRPEVSRTIELIRDRARVLSALGPSRPQEVEVHRPSPRSDLLATQEQLGSLEARINTVRGLLFTHGKPLPERSDYDEWKEEDEWRTLEEQQKFYWDKHKYGGDSLDVMADMEAPKSKGPENGTRLLFVNSESGEMDIMIVLDFAGNFGLAMDFQQGNYASSKRPLGEMTNEEYTIINGCLGTYINLASQ